jgi:hypothetical protein
LPDLLTRARDEEERDPLIDVRLDREEKYQGVAVDRVPGVSGWITVVRGCDKFCSFCIVPFVRGRERSLPPEEVVSEARQMASEGFKEVTLLGQTVNSYNDGTHDFADLLKSSPVNNEAQAEQVLSRLAAYYAASLPVALRHPFPAPDDARDAAFDDVLDPAATRDGIDPALRALYDALGPPRRRRRGRERSHRCGAAAKRAFPVPTQRLPSTQV